MVAHLVYVYFFFLNCEQNVVTFINFRINIIFRALKITPINFGKAIIGRFFKLPSRLVSRCEVSFFAALFPADQLGLINCKAPFADKNMQTSFTSFGISSCVWVATLL